MARVTSTPTPRPLLSAWRFVAVFGVVSLLADVVYEGARSITGPLLASLGATGLVVGVVTGVGEAAALGLRLVSGPLADRTRRFWAWTLAGYAITVISVPMLGIAGTLWVAGGLVITERIGKAVRSPAKDTLLSHATHVTGRGRGFAVHEALDQIGAVLGPLVVSVMLALTGDDYGPTLAILALPGVATLALLVWLRLRVPEPALYEPVAPDEPGPTDPTRRTIPGLHPGMPRRFWIYLGFTATTMIGFTTFGLLSFHMAEQDIVPTPAVPLIYTAAMAADAVAALATGWAYDRYGARTLAALPLLAALTPVLAFTDTILLVIAGTLLWGAAVGIQESTLRAVVADLVTPPRRATAYGIFAAGLGAATALGGVLTGWLYDVSIPALMVTVVVVQLVAVAVGVAIVRR